MISSFGNAVRGSEPSGVTTTVSSMRTPPTPGRYTPGSTVTTEPGSKVSRALAATRGSSWISRPDAVAGAVHERVAPSGRRDDLATGTVDRRAVGAGAHRLASRPLALAHDVPHAAGIGTGIADAHGAGHVGAVAVDDAPEVDDDELAGSRPGGRSGVRGAWPRWVPTPRSGRSCCRSRRDGASRPRARARSHARWGVRARRGSIAPRASSAIEQAAWMRATSPGSFTRRRVSTRPWVGTSS